MPLALPQSLDFFYNLSPASPMPALTEFEDYPYYFTLPKTALLNDILQRPNHFFLEVGPRSVIEQALATMSREAPHFAVNLRTGSAYDSTLSEVIALALERRFFLDSKQGMNIRTCLQEAIANAIIHGNLGLDSSDNFHLYHDAIAARIGETPYKDKRITIAAWYDAPCIKLAVTDQGNGFSGACHLTDLPPPSDPCGRGLFLIRSLADSVRIGDDNCTLAMTFTP